MICSLKNNCFYNLLLSSIKLIGSLGKYIIRIIYPSSLNEKSETRKIDQIAREVIETEWNKSPSTLWSYSVIDNKFIFSRIKNGKEIQYEHDKDNSIRGIKKISPFSGEDFSSSKGKVIKTGSWEFKLLLHIYKLNSFKKISGIISLPKAYIPSKGRYPNLFILSKYDGSWYDFLHQNDQYSLCQDVYSLYQVSQGIKFLHNHSIFHSDIKLQNVLYRGKDQSFDLADFGSARFLPENFDQLQLLDFLEFTPEYSVDTLQEWETLRKGEDLKVCQTHLLSRDIFAFGVLMKVVLLHQRNRIKYPNPNQTQITVEEKLKYSLSHELVELVNSMLSPNWRNRPNIEFIEKTLSNEHNIASSGKITT